MLDHFDIVLPSGTPFTLTGLQEEKYNGSPGRILHANHVETTGRVRVLLDSGKQLNAKPINLAFGVVNHANEFFEYFGGPAFGDDGLGGHVN